MFKQEISIRYTRTWKMLLSTAQLKYTIRSIKKSTGIKLKFVWFYNKVVIKSETSYNVQCISQSRDRAITTVTWWSGDLHWYRMYLILHFQITLTSFHFTQPTRDIIILSLCHWICSLYNKLHNWCLSNLAYKFKHDLPMSNKNSMLDLNIHPIFIFSYIFIASILLQKIWYFRDYD